MWDFFTEIAPREGLGDERQYGDFGVMAEVDYGMGQRSTLRYCMVWQGCFGARRSGREACARPGMREELHGTVLHAKIREFRNSTRNRPKNRSLEFRSTA